MTSFNYDGVIIGSGFGAATPPSADAPSLNPETPRQITVQMTVARDVAEVLDVITGVAP